MKKLLRASIMFILCISFFASCSKKGESKQETIAATVIAFPLMYRNARAAFEQVELTMIYAAEFLQQ